MYSDVPGEAQVKKFAKLRDWPEFGRQEAEASMQEPGEELPEPNRAGP